MRVLLLLSLALVYVSAGTGKSMGGAGAFQAAAPAALFAAGIHHYHIIYH
jgi:hypothetical protein